MSASYRLLSLILLLLLVVATPRPWAAPAAAIPKTASTETAAGEAQPHAIQSPLIRAIHERIEVETRALNQLRERFESAHDPHEAMEIQHEIRRVKIQTEIAILELQRDHAVQLGKTEQAKQIEASIELMRNPPRPKAPMARPRPSGVPSTEGSR